MGWTGRGSNPGGGEISHTSADQPSKVGTGLSPGCKAVGALVDLPPPSSAEVKERVEMYPYSASGPKSEFNLILIYVCSFKYFYVEHIIKTAAQQTGLTARYTA